MANDKNIWITGASGFLGSGIVEHLLYKNYSVCCTIRNATNLWRCNEWLHHPNFKTINTERENWFTEVCLFNPGVFIHSAWSGVDVTGRNDWNIQLDNVNYSFNMLQKAKEAGVQKVIMLGSQAEYGNFNKRIKEDGPLNPTSAYGAAKIAVQQLSETFCRENKLDFYWLRLFSFLGKKEHEDWLVSSVVKKILLKSPVNLTLCEQYYDYSDLYFLSRCIETVIKTEGEQGAYNLGSDSSVQLKEMINRIAIKLHEYDPQINFGAIPYRENQIMHMEGDSTKFYHNFDIQYRVNLEKGIEDTIYFLKQKYIK